MGHPGLIDAHTHFEGTAVHLARFADCHVPPHMDIPGILESLREHAGRNPDALWVFGQGSFMLREKLREGRLPSLAEMDAAVPDRPTLIRAGAHISVVNSRALAVIGVTDDFVPPPGAHVERDADGRPTGVLMETGFGDEHPKVGAVKFFVDGGITGAAGAFHDDDAHEPGNKGNLKLSREDTFELVRRIDDANPQISTHVGGDRALDMLLDAYEAYPATWGKRHRLEHAGHLCMTAERIDRIKGMGLVPAVTMPFLSSLGAFLPEYLGERADGAFALRRMLDTGLPVAGSSDSLGAQPESLNPKFGMWCSVTCRT